MIGAARIDGALAQCALAFGLSAADRAEILRVAVTRNLRKGQLLFNEGEPATGMFLVVEGLVKVFKLAQDGREKVLYVFPSGETLAEAALFGEGRYPASAQAVGPATVAVFPRQPLMQLLRDRPELCFRMLAGMSVKLKYLGQRIEELTFQSASMRLASHLVAELDRRRKPQLRLELSKRELAAVLGMTPETLSRLLASLRESGVIDVRGRTVTVLSPEQLRRLAAGRQPAHDAA